MDFKKEIARLHPLERTVAPFLKEGATISEIEKKSGLQNVEVVRALQWLSNKKFISMKKMEAVIVSLTKEGRKYQKKGLPEIKFLNAIEKKPLKLQDILQEAMFSEQEMRACIGLLKRKAAIEMREGAVLITENGKKMLSRTSPEEEILMKLAHNLDLRSLPQGYADTVKELKRRGIVEEREDKDAVISLTGYGKKLVKYKFGKEPLIDRITPSMLESKSWKKHKLRAYDVEINVPKIYGGKRHFVRQAMEYAKQVWLDMGFTEMTGPLINTSFWNFDTLFTAQDHPVREMQDTFFIREPKEGILPEKKIVSGVRAMHEKGSAVGSSGWGYEWNPDEAVRNVMRTHTTVLSSKTLAGLKKEDIPAKFFALGRCFRNETVDWSHLFEFNQTEGIVVDPNANLRNLFGYLKQFFENMGFPKARFRPAYFPYTEPSVEVDVYHPEKRKWIELGGAGIFRPEVVQPLVGEDIPVLAWGLGIGRIIMDYYELKDVRNLYSNDLKQMKEMKLWMR